MAAEPIVIYSHKIDPAGVLALLRQMAPELTVQGSDENWTQITIRHCRGRFRKPLLLTFSHSVDYYTGPEWAEQMSGMQGYFSRFPENENTGRIMWLIQSFRFSLTTFPPPEPDLALGSGDPRLQYVEAVVKHLDGAIFTPSALRDGAGRVLYGAYDPDPDAVMPAIYRSVETSPRSERTRSEGGELPDADDPPPPDAERVARRACALAAVCGRALLEQDDPANPDVEETRQDIIKWVQEIGIRDELEPDEWQMLQLPLGAPEQQDTLNSTWRLEGLVVLAWALNLVDMPPHDGLVTPGDLLPSVGILRTEQARSLLQEPRLRPAEELQQFGRQMFALHWRLTNWRLKPASMNFREFARTAWFGPLDISNLPLLEDDLAIRGAPLSRADANAIGAASSAAMERHLAINWLNGGSEVYSQTDVST